VRRIPPVLAAALILAVAGPRDGTAQLTLRDLVITGGVSGEGYQGTLPSASAVARDSTDAVSAVVGEVGARGSVVWRRNGVARAHLSFDGGMRQFSARGFELRDYAPREWAGMADASFFQNAGERLLLSGSVRARGRSVEDRPPMPLFLQPGYGAVTATLGGEWGRTAEPRYDLSLSVNRTDFLAPRFAPQVRLLNRESAGIQVGTTRPFGEGGSVRGFAALEESRYPGQSTFVDDDPFRRDRTLRAGGRWAYQGDVLAEVGAEGRLNRSNSRRPEYNSVTVEGRLSAPIPGGAVVTGYAALTLKRYLEATPFARLIPGEEANNASVAFVSLNRGIARNLDGTLRLGWTRAESELGGDYFQRFGAYFLLNYRPLL
jgi:hypothetical protein